MKLKNKCKIKTCFGNQFIKEIIIKNAEKPDYILISGLTEKNSEYQLIYISKKDFRNLIKSEV